MPDERNLDISAIMAELDEEFSDTETKPETEVEETETVLENQEDNNNDIDESEENNPDEEEEEVEEEEAEEETEVINKALEDEDIHKRNSAFKEMREERDKFKQSDEFMDELAKSYGLTKEQLMERFTKQQEEASAKEQGIAPEQYRKIKELETRVKKVEEEKAREVFNIKAEAFAQRYSLDGDGLTTIFREGYKLGIDVTQNPDLLEVVYKSMNYEKAAEEGRQKHLETTKKRRKTSTGKVGTKGSREIDTTEQDWDAEIEKYLKNNNIL